MNFQTSDLLNLADLRAEAAEARELASTFQDGAASANLLAYAAALESGFAVH